MEFVRALLSLFWSSEGKANASSYCLPQGGELSHFLWDKDAPDLKASPLLPNSIFYHPDPRWWQEQPNESPQNYEIGVADEEVSAPIFILPCILQYRV